MRQAGGGGVSRGGRGVGQVPSLHRGGGRAGEGDSSLGLTAWSDWGSWAPALELAPLGTRPGFRIGATRGSRHYKAGGKNEEEDLG